MARRIDSDDSDDDAPESDRPMSLSEHLDELRVRLLRCVAYVIVLSCVTYYFMDSLTGVVLAPVRDLVDENKVKLITDQPTEGFFTVMKVVLFWAIFFAAPLVVLELWRFVASGLHPHEKRGVRIFAPFSWLLFVAGIVFSQLVMMPVMLYFLFDFNAERSSGIGMEITNLPRLATVVDLVLMMALVMGLIFQLPLVMLFAQKIGVVTWRIYAGYRRHFIMGSLVLAAVLTPTGDPVSLTICMAPVLLLFELGIWLCRVSEKKALLRTTEDSQTP